MTDQVVAVVVEEPTPVVAEVIIGGIGPKGDKGDDGGPGETGPPGPEGKLPPGFVYDQGVASSTWSINHKLKRYPSVVVQDSAKDEVEGDIEYVDEENLVLNFSSAFSGKAYLN